MDIIHAIVLGIVEGVTEFLPVSSTAHLDIATSLLGIRQSEFIKTFTIVIQLGAVLAVVVLHFRTLQRDIDVWKRIVVGFIPTGIIGFLLYKVIKGFLLGNTDIILWSLGIGGILLIVFEYIYGRNEPQPREKEIATMPYKTAFLVGVAQSLAVVPGVSRSAASIVAGRMLGMSRSGIVEYSFLLAIPTMLAAAGYDFMKSAPSFSSHEFIFLSVGFVTAFVSALVTIRWLLSFVQRRGFILFGMYRIALALIIWISFALLMY